MCVFVCVWSRDHGTVVESQQRTRGGSQSRASSTFEGQLLVLYSLTQQHVDDKSSTVVDLLNYFLGFLRASSSRYRHAVSIYANQLCGITSVSHAKITDSVLHTV